MKKEKIVTEYIENRFGFPVILYNVPMVEVRGEWLPKINYARLADAVLKSLANKPSFLTGNEIRFIRNKFEMTLEEFGKRFYVSHQAVMKWEDSKGQPTKMSWATEKDMRLFIYKKLYDRGLLEIYSKLEQRPESSVKQNTGIDIKNLDSVLV